MSGDEVENLGLSEAHTRRENSDAEAAIEPDAERVQKVGTVRASVEAAMGDLAAQLSGDDEDEAEQASLMLDDIDEQQCLFGGPVRHVAETIDRSRKGPGRPKGSKNKRSAEFADTLLRMGYRHPGINLAMMANADPAELAIELGALPPPPEGMSAHDWLSKMILANAIKRDQVIGLMTKAQEHIGRANAELLPYFESKAPTKVSVNKKEMRGVMIIGNMDLGDQSERKTIDLTKFDDPNE